MIDFSLLIGSAIGGIIEPRAGWVVLLVGCLIRKYL